MRWIEVRADLRANSFAQFQQRFRVVYDKAGMHLESHFANSMFAYEAQGLVPIGNDHLLPLVIEYVQVIWRPGARDPVRLFIAAGAARAAAERSDNLDP